MTTNNLTTWRLVLRHWREDDLAPFAAMWADADVMKYLGGPKSADEAIERAHKYQAHFEQYGFGFWVIEVPGITSFAGIAGLKHGDYVIPAYGTDWIDIGWSLVRNQWGHGYATEAAQAALNHAQREIHVGQVLAIVSPENKRSRRVLERIGLHYRPDADFDFPGLPEDEPNKQRMVYVS